MFIIRCKGLILVTVFIVRINVSQLFVLPIQRLTCVGGKIISINDDMINIKDLNCSKDVSFDLQNMNTKCGNNLGQVLSIGYSLPDRWVPLFEVCFSFINNIGLYARHTIHGAVLGGSYKGNDRPTFKNTGLPKNVSWNTIYTRKYQQQRFKDLLGEELGEQYVGGKKAFLSRGHLAADADFHFRSWQYSTYSYANVGSQWQSFNGGNWAKVERAVRKAAEILKMDFDIITGTSEVLELEDENKKKVKIYLANDTVPVPKYFWKIVCSSTHKCIGFIGYNDPNPMKNATVCTDVCQSTGWYDKDFDYISKGLVKCCSIDEMKQRFDFPRVTVKDLLEKPT